MKLIVEGPDNSGKSTLVRKLHEAFDIPIIPGRGPGRSTYEINHRVCELAKLDKGLFDRHPCVSQEIYNRFRAGGPVIDPELIDQFYKSPKFFIYCRGRPSLKDHVIKDTDALRDKSGTTHQEVVERSHLDICKAYDEWALDHANYVYRIGDDFTKLEDVVRRVMGGTSFDPVRDIEDFHLKFRLDYGGPPRSLPESLSVFRKAFMSEELQEYRVSEAQARSEKIKQEGVDLAEYAFHLDQMLDALVDLTYVVLGTSYLHGFDFREAWRRVHSKNMEKVRVKSEEDSKRGSIYDVVKPEGWEAPSHIDMVERNDLSLKFDQPKARNAPVA